MTERKEEPNRQEREKLAAWYPDYFVVGAGFGIGSWTVSRETARHIERALDQRRPPRWIRFVDVVGSRIRLQTSLIRYLHQSTAETREMWRRVDRERSEESGEEPWESKDNW